MLVVGGQVWLDEAWQESSSMVQFDLMRRTWSEVKQHGEQPAPRMKCASATIGNQLFMLSGDQVCSSYQLVSYTPPKGTNSRGH